MRKTIILCAVMIFLGLSTAVFATYAWVKTNINTVGNGPTVNASTSADVIIFSDSENINWSDPYSLNLIMPVEHTVTRFVPATHSDTSESLLKYSVDASEINGTTGLRNGGGSITFGDVLINDNSRFYVDYTFYLAAYGKKILNGDLSASILNEQDRTTYLAASSIDFYVNDVYIDTLNIAGYDASVNNHSTEKTSVDLGQHSFSYYDDTTILPVKITLRCYFDGALLKTDTQAFISKETIKSTDLAGVDLDVCFEVSNGEESN